MSETVTGGPRRALILDRDGVINRDTGYVHRIADCRFIDGIFALTSAFTARGFALVIATNQSGIGRGYFGQDDFAFFMAWMKAEFEAHGAPIAGIYHCPYHPIAGLGSYRRDSDWRKPGPGMILQAQADLDLDLDNSWCVGDRIQDVRAARAAGVGKRILLDPVSVRSGPREDYWVVSRLSDITALLAGRK